MTREQKKDIISRLVSDFGISQSYIAKLVNINASYINQALKNKVCINDALNSRFDVILDYYLRQIHQVRNILEQNQTKTKTNLREV